MESILHSTTESNGKLALLEQIFILMCKNASPQDVKNFLFDAGMQLSQVYKVTSIDSLDSFHLEVNDNLEKLGFGVSQFDDLGDMIEIKNFNLPLNFDDKFADKWLTCFGFVLCGLYNGWFRQTGAPAGLFCDIKELISPNTVNLVLKKR